jgi:hypothetical protein
MRIFVLSGVMHKKFEAHASALGIKNERVIALILPVDAIVQLIALAVERTQQDPQENPKRETMQLIDKLMESLSTDFFDTNSHAICRYRHLSLLAAMSQDDHRTAKRVRCCPSWSQENFKGACPNHYLSPRYH